MITLKVEPYCEECQYFSPDEVRTQIFGDGSKMIVKRVITCCDSQKCRYLKDMFKRFEKENEK